MSSHVVEAATPLLSILGDIPRLREEDADVAAKHRRLRQDVARVAPLGRTQVVVDRQRLQMMHLLIFMIGKNDDLSLAYYTQ